MKRVCIINVVGLTQELVPHAPAISGLGKAHAWQSPLPAVTLTAQATMLTGLPPSGHGIVGNGWRYPDTSEVRFWQQSHSLLNGEAFYNKYDTQSIFWWFSMGASINGYVVPRPFYGADGSKSFAVLDRTGCDLENILGAFPFHSFWGPAAGEPSSRWIANAAARVMRYKKPQLTMVYLPHLDYDYQRVGPGSAECVREVDACAKIAMDAAADIDAQVVVLSEYGLVPVARAVELNRSLRRAGMIETRDGPYGENLLLEHCRAFAVCDHQLAHIYVKDADRSQVADILSGLPGVDKLVEPAELELDHARSGQLIALAKPDAWFAYPWWLDDNRAPDYARTVGIHQKQGYDPCELFMTSKLRAAGRLAQKKLGMRYLMDVIPLDPSLVKGSHGLHTAPEKGPMIIAENPPDDMKDLGDWVRGQLG